MLTMPTYLRVTVSACNKCFVGKVIYKKKKRNAGYLSFGGISYQSFGISSAYQ